MNTNLQHDATGHAFGLIALGVEIKDALAIAADIGFGLDKLTKRAGVDVLAYHAEVRVVSIPRKWSSHEFNRVAR